MSQCCPACSTASLQEKGLVQVAAVLQRKATNVVLQRAPLEAGGWYTFSFKNLIQGAESIPMPKCGHPGSARQCWGRRGGQGAGSDAAATAGGHGRGGFCSQMQCWFQLSPWGSMTLCKVSQRWWQPATPESRKTCLASQNGVTVSPSWWVMLFRWPVLAGQVGSAG